MKASFQVFDSLLEPCFVLNEDLKVVYCNETAATMCGLTIRKTQRMTFPELFSFSEPLEWLSAIKSVTETTPYKEVHFKTSEGGEGKVQITCQPVADQNDVPHWIVYVRDVTLEERLQKKYRGELEQKEGYILELQKAQAELEKYSKNLEKMVEERTAEIRQLNRLMSALLDSLGQGFFVFDAQGQCLDFSSKACEVVLEGRPNNRPVWEVLQLPDNKVEGFKKWTLTLFADMLPFEDLAPLGPPTYPHSEGRQIRLEYFPLKNEEGAMTGIVVVASDITSLVEAQKEAETERENARLILNLINKKQQTTRFVRETQAILRDLHKALQEPNWDPDLIFRLLHTVKGGCASFNVLKTAQEAHEAENQLSIFREDPSSIRAESLKKQCARMGEAFQLFITETEKVLGAHAFSEDRRIEMSVEDIKTLCSQISHWTKGAELADQLKRKYLFEEIGSFFEPYDDVTQKVASELGKRIQPLRLSNAKLGILPEVYSTLFGTFVHAFRNAVDHGIESPEKRLERGKSEEGQIEIRFRKTNENLRIEIQDDGNGIDPARIRQKLEGKGISTAHESDEAVIQHVFDASFSTRDVITETSGRGVGMDAIKIAAEELGGSCRVESQLGKGTLLIVEVPWLEEKPKLLENKKAA